LRTIAIHSSPANEAEFIEEKANRHSLDVQDVFMTALFPTNQSTTLKLGGHQQQPERSLMERRGTYEALTATS